MRAALILNPRSGAMARLGNPRQVLESAIVAAGFAVVAQPDHDAPPEQQWAGIGAAEVVFVAGGDGTLRAVAECAMADSAMGGDRILGLLPGGTMNRVCARLGLPPDPVAAVGCYRPGRVAHHDVATVNGQPFLYQSLIGAPARLLRFREMQRGSGLGGWLPLVRAMGRSLWRAPWHVLVLPGATRRLGPAAVVTTAEPDAPRVMRLDLVPGHSLLARIRQSLRWFAGRLHDDPDVVSVHGERLLLHGRRRALRVSLDGEMMLLEPPLRFRLRRDALRILDPVGAP